MKKGLAVNIALLVCAVVLGCCVQPTNQTNVYWSDSFLDKVCVCTHGWYPNASTLLKMVKDMGVRTIRDGINTIPLAQQNGLRVMVAIDSYQSNNKNITGLQTYFNQIKQLIANGAQVDSFEGPNEPNGFWPMFNFTYNGQGYPDGVLPMVKDIWSILKNDPVLKGYPLLGPAWSQASAQPYPSGAFTPYVDWGDFHPYATANCFAPPQAYIGIPDYFCQSHDPINTWASDYAPTPYVWNEYYPPFSPKPMAVSEVGYTTITGGVSEIAQGKYYPRQYLEGFREGLQRTCIYEFYDEGNDKTQVEQNWGFVRNNFTLKPSYLVTRDLLTMLADPGSTFTPNSLNITFTVSPVGQYTWTRLVHNLVFQKRTGVYYIALWHEIAMEWYPKSGGITYLSHPDLPTTITFPSGRSITSATVYSWDDNGKRTSATPSIINKNQIVTGAQPQVRIITVTLA